MIIVLRDELFEGQETNDLELLTLLASQLGRYKVRIEPAYRPRGETAFHRWLALQSLQAQEQIRNVLERGLKEREYSLPGWEEPRVLVERCTEPLWPDSLVSGPVKLPLEAAKDMLARPLRLLLENGRNDWGFLNKIVPDDWKERWIRAVDQRWIEQENSGGITEMLNIIEQQIAEDDPRRLRTWVMFDSDGRAKDDFSKQSEDVRIACETWSISYRRLRRRAIENYIPKETLFDWAQRRSTKSDQDKKRACVQAYWSMTPEQRHYYNLKEGFRKDSKSEEGNSAIYEEKLVNPSGPLWSGMHAAIAQDVWGEDPNREPHKIYAISETAFKGESEDFEHERALIFQSIFGML